MKKEQGQIKLKLKAPKTKGKTTVKLSKEDHERFMKNGFSQLCINAEIDRLIERRQTERKNLWEYMHKKYNLADERTWVWAGKQELYIEESREENKE